MKHLIITTVVFGLLSGLPTRAQTTTTATSSATTSSKGTTKATATSTTTPNSTTKPATKPTPVIVWDGTGPWQRTGDGAQAKSESTDHWPTPSYEENAMRADRSADTAEGSQYLLRCRRSEGGECSERELDELSRRTMEKRSEHPDLAEISSLQPVGKASTVSCRKVDGMRCAGEQLRALNEHVAEPLGYRLFEATNELNNTKSSSNSTEESSDRSNRMAEAERERDAREASRTPTTPDKPSATELASEDSHRVDHHAAPEKDHPEEPAEHRPATRETHPPAPHPVTKSSTAAKPQ